MRAANIDTKLAIAISNEVPDVLDDILSKCETRSGNKIEISNSNNKSNKWMKSIYATAAALALLVGGYFVIGQYQMVHTVDSVITLDVNPSVELKVNTAEIVLSATGLNQDGNSVINDIKQDGVKLTGRKLDEAVNELVCSMVEKGYFSELKNSILISVENSDNEKSIEIKTRLLKSVGNALSEKGIDGAILGQIGTPNEKISELAEKYGISTGKASLIESIVAKTTQFSFEDLAELNISDLSLLAEKWIGEMQNISMVGTPSSKGYISSEIAIDRACANLNIALNDNLEIGTSLELADGKLIYDVSVITDNMKYEYLIDAKTGSIIDWVTSVIDTETMRNGHDSNSVNSDSVEPDLPEEPTKEIADDIIDIITDITSKAIQDTNSQSTLP
ncbi:MAG: hypothetical protein CVU91_05985 [Firmicutes bacterium HGW-Firmicutes-16]|nr:MAG: hypothetical protein CVU91_05985 [Firmicutes bacterium HGW-Firmicutes-16]